VSTIEELLGRKSSGSGLESREYGQRDPSLPENIEGFGCNFNFNFVVVTVLSICCAN
jgi:hypothetical protein